MEKNDLDQHPIHRTLAEANPAPIVDVASGTVTYKGYAKLGADPAKPMWKIERITIAGNITTTEYADCNMNYDNVWNDRATLSYSR